ncbi:MAG: DNA replication/repair protein RecF, partial [Pseudomonadota bacterium]|nr:DNA replication/repair protein RecF [Pseudomonadota bacterium]
DPVKDKRLVRINGEAAKGQNALAEYLSCVWLTPQMDGLFLDGSSSRRRFFDRLVFTFDPAHSGRITRYENALRQRSKLLQEGHADPVWVQGLEASMAETGVAIAAARLDFVQRLQAACDVAAKDEHEAFPRSQLGLHGTLEELLLNAPALEVEDLFKYQLEQSRRLDATTGGAATGPHKTDVLTKYAAKNMPADQCSTGEQKALLIGIILAHSRLIKAERGVPPILLLDEVAAHLDDTRRHLLHDILLSLGGQVWLTGTDKALFDDLRGKAVFFEVNDSRITGQPDNKNAAKVA